MGRADIERLPVKLDKLERLTCRRGGGYLVNRSALVGEVNFRALPYGHIEGLLIKTVDKFCNNRRKQVVLSGVSNLAAMAYAL